MMDSSREVGINNCFHFSHSGVNIRKVLGRLCLRCIFSRGFMILVLMVIMGIARPVGARIIYWIVSLVVIDKEFHQSKKWCNDIRE